MRGNSVEQTGFTLIELLVTMAIVSVLLGVAAPSFTNLIQGGTLTVGANELISSFRLARSEAVKRASRSVVCVSSDSMAGSPSCDGNADWADGWIVFADDNDNGDLDTGEDLIQAHEPLKYGMTITADPVFSDYVSFNELGSSTTLANSFSSGTITLSYASDSRTLSIMSNGRIKVQ